tara:strand:- start:166 stop:657 length:492 start_codon:yes stop_codon:yes gene_type:complete
MVWKPVISDVGIKFVDATNAAQPEIKVSNTLINQWEELTFDFSSRIGVYPIVKDQIVIFPDFDIGGRAQDNVIYFDNVYGSVSNTSITTNNKESLTLYPNPAQDFVTIQNTSGSVNVEVFDVIGNFILKSKDKTIDISNMPNGIYIFIITTNNSNEILKLIKK